MRALTCPTTLGVVALVVASAARAATIVSPGPPVTPADWLEVDLFWTDGTPGFVSGRASDLPSIKVEVVNNHFWLKRVFDAPDPQHNGSVEVFYASAPMMPTRVVLLKLQPDIDAGQASVDLNLGAPTGGQRTVVVSGSNGYARTFNVADVPEPTTLALALAGCLRVRRRRTRG